MWHHVSGKIALWVAVSGESGVAGEGRVVGVRKFHSWGKCNIALTNINSDWMCNASSGLCINLHYLIFCILGCKKIHSESNTRTCNTSRNGFPIALQKNGYIEYNGNHQKRYVQSSLHWTYYQCYTHTCMVHVSAVSNQYLHASLWTWLVVPCVHTKTIIRVFWKMFTMWGQLM